MEQPEAVKPAVQPINGAIKKEPARPIEPTAWGLSEQERVFIRQLQGELSLAQLQRGAAFKALDDAEKACALAEAQLRGALRSIAVAHGVPSDVPFSLSPDGTRLVR